MDWAGLWNDIVTYFETNVWKHCLLFRDFNSWHNHN